MVKNGFVFLMVLAGLSVSRADLFAGISTNSWQEKIPVVAGGVESQSLTSFSGYGVNVGFDDLFQPRVRYALMFSYIGGNADIHKLEAPASGQAAAISPRLNFYSLWLTNKVHWRVTKSFSFGPSFVLNQRKADRLNATLSAGGFLDFDFDLFDQVRLTQSLGTMSDSNQLAYAFALTRKF